MNTEHSRPEPTNPAPIDLRPATSADPRPDPAAAFWDERYSAGGRIWSGEPNHALVTEFADVPPCGSALDVGCGEGADAVWLAQRGWSATGLDPSSVALGRARRAGTDAGVDVTWVHGGLTSASLPTSDFELVIAMYPALPLDNAPLPTLLDLVAPGGTLLFVHHANFRPHGHDAGERHSEHAGHDRTAEPPEFLDAEAVAAALRTAPGWTVDVDERRGRVITGGTGARHDEDVIVRARRTA